MSLSLVAIARSPALDRDQLLQDIRAAGVSSDRVLFEARPATRGEPNTLLCLLEPQERAALHEHSLQVVAENVDAPDNSRDGYLTVEQTRLRLEALATTYPDAVQVSELPHLSREGEKCYTAAVHVGPRSERSVVVLVGGQHGGELGSTDILIFLLESILASHRAGGGMILGGRFVSAASLKRTLEAIELVVVPLVNPDGRRHTQKTRRMWRKNRWMAPDGTSTGVDLNRNYDWLWNFPQHFSPQAFPASENVHDATYHGTSAFSEPETQNVRHLLDRYSNVQLFIDLHSGTEAILHPWADDDWGWSPEWQGTDTTKMKWNNPAYSAVRGITGRMSTLAADAYYSCVDRDVFDNMRRLGVAVSRTMFQARATPAAPDAGVHYRVDSEASGLYVMSGNAASYAMARGDTRSSAGSRTWAFTIEWGSFSRWANSQLLQPPYNPSAGIDEFTPWLNEVTSGLWRACELLEQVVPNLEISASRLSFGDVPVDVDAATRTVTLTNRGTRRLIVSAGIPQVPTHGFSAPDLGEALLLEPGTSHAIAVQYAPQDDGVAHEAALLVHVRCADIPAETTIPGYPATGDPSLDSFLEVRKVDLIGGRRVPAHRRWVVEVGSGLETELEEALSLQESEDGRQMLILGAATVPGQRLDPLAIALGPRGELAWHARFTDGVSRACVAAKLEGQQWSVMCNSFDGAPHSLLATIDRTNGLVRTSGRRVGTKGPIGFGASAAELATVHGVARVINASTARDHRINGPNGPIWLATTISVTPNRLVGLGRLRAAGSEILLVGFTTGGAIEWSRTLSCPQIPMPNATSRMSVQQAPDGSLYVGVSSARTLWLARLDAQGNVANGFARLDADTCEARVVAADEAGCLVAGRISDDSPLAATQWTLTRFTLDGGVLWRRALAPTINRLSAARACTDGSIIAAGLTGQMTAPARVNLAAYRVGNDGRFSPRAADLASGPKVNPTAWRKVMDFLTRLPPGNLSSPAATTGVTAIDPATVVSTVPTLTSSEADVAIEPVALELGEAHYRATSKGRAEWDPRGPTWVALPDGAGRRRYQLDGTTFSSSTATRGYALTVVGRRVTFMRPQNSAAPVLHVLGAENQLIEELAYHETLEKGILMLRGNARISAPTGGYIVMFRSGDALLETPAGILDEVIH